MYVEKYREHMLDHYTIKIEQFYKLTITIEEFYKLIHCQ